MTESSSKQENAPSQCTESSKESLIRPTEETNHTDEDNNILKSVSKSDIDRNEIESLGKSLSNITKRINQYNLDKSDLASLQILEDILKEVNDMNKTLGNCDNAARLKAMESHVKRETETKQTSEKVKRVIKERKHQSAHEPSTQPPNEMNAEKRRNTHPVTDKKRTINVNVEVHIGNDDQVRKCDCDSKEKKESVENEDTKF